MGGESEFLLLGFGCLESKYRHLVNFLSFDNDDTKPSKASSHCIVDFCFKINYCSKIKNWHGSITTLFPSTNVKKQFLNHHGFLSF